MSIPIIKKLDEMVINRIAAGEVVQKPSSALKELLENSLDAKSSNIIVTVKGGGLQLLQIQDNGHGIRREDLSILCERFTTSKLGSFDDLKSIQTYGFRGEALSSITHVSNVTITTKTAASPCAYKTIYTDGKIKVAPKPIAGMTGTTITVEDLFHNMPTRRGALKNASEQYNKILDVVIRYSIHHGDNNISFTCKRTGQMTPDYQTPPSISCIDNIRTAYGSSLVTELINISSSFHIKDHHYHQHDDPHIIIQGKISNANYNNKKCIFILFINNRLVDNTSIRKVIDNIYAPILPKLTHPFIYLSLSMPPSYVDVNIHPTKKEVRFLYEDEILIEIHRVFVEALSSSNHSRVFYTQTLLSSTLSSSLSSSYEASSLPVIASSLVEDHHNQPDDDVIGVGTYISKSFDQYAAIQQHDADVEHDRHITSSSSSSTANHVMAHVDASREEVDHDDLDTMIEAPNDVDEVEWDENVDVYQVASKKRKYKDDAIDDHRHDDDMMVPPKKHVEAYDVMKSSSSHQPTTIHVPVPQRQPRNKTSSSLSSSSSSSSVPSHKLVRSDYRDQRIDRFLISNSQHPPPSSSTSSMTLPEHNIDDNDDDDDSGDEERNEDMVYCQPIGSKPASNNDNIHQPGTCDCCINPSASILPSSASASTIILPSSSSPPPPSSSSVPCGYQATSCDYTSIQQLIAEIDTISNTRHTDTHTLSIILKHHIFVGVVDEHHSIIQYQTRLYLINHHHLNRHLFYQLVLKRFQCLPRLALSTPIAVNRLIEQAMSYHASSSSASSSPSCDELVVMLISHTSMLSEYFSIDIDDNGMLTSMPDILPLRPRSSSSSSVSYFPSSEWLSDFIYDLASSTNWLDEKQCFRSIAQHLACYYAHTQVHVSTNDEHHHSEHHISAKHHHMMVAEVLYPSYLKHLVIPKQCADDGSFRQIATLEQLYRVFERC